MTFEEFWKENYEKEFGTSEPYYGIASYAFEEGQENCNCVYTNNSKVIQKLETRIEKMKCCENCKYNSYWGNELHCNYGLKEALQEDKLVECKNMDKWEIKENG